MLLAAVACGHAALGYTGTLTSHNLMNTRCTLPLAAAPIGVFDSGIGGLSVLQALRHELPHEHFVYLADSSHAPYGERGEAFVQERTLAIAQYLQQQCRIKALVIACNTATAAAVDLLRAQLPELLLIGVEPAIKPAALSSQTRHIGVIGTRGTVHSRRFQKLVQEHGQYAQIHVQACDGLARAIELSTQLENTQANAEIEALCTEYTSALGTFGLKTGEMDTLVLGCTHYVFAKDVLRALLGLDVQLMDTGPAVARQTRRLLERDQLLAAEPVQAIQPSQGCTELVQLMTTGKLSALQAAAARWLALPADCCSAVQVHSANATSSPINTPL